MRSLVVIALLAACGDNNQAPDASNGPPADDATADAPVTAAPDPRFQWVGAAPAFTVGTTEVVTFAGGMGTQMGSPSGNVLTPLQLTVDGLIAGNRSWNTSPFAPTVPVQAGSVDAVVRGDVLAALDSDVTGDLATHDVLTSLDVLSDSFAYVMQKAGDGGTYTLSQIDAPRAQLDAMIQAAAATGVVTTAISASPTAGQIRAYGFARSGDTTGYDTLVVDCTPADVGAQATTLGQGGYIITAFGHVADDQMILVGTRSNANARTVTVQTGDAGLVPDLSNGDAVVAWSFSTTATPATTIVVER